jgi:hypothetical protein
MKRLVTLLSLGLLVGAASAATAQNVIQSAGSLFVPSFRGEENSTWFGWGEGSFFTTPAAGSRRRLDNPAPTVGNIGLADGVQFYQLNWTDTAAEVIGSGSNNLYKGGLGAGTKPEVSLTLSAPTLGQPGSGFTTIIIQGTSLSSGTMGPADGFLINQPSFGSINGVAPEFLMGATFDSRAQFWVKYELTGNQSVYDIPIYLPPTENSAPVNIAGLTVDTYWSATGFASDFAVIPESSTWLLIGLGMGVLLITLRKKRIAACH